jgi:hypothetical protein
LSPQKDFDGSIAKNQFIGRPSDTETFDAANVAPKPSGVRAFARGFWHRSDGGVGCRDGRGIAIRVLRKGDTCTGKNHYCGCSGKEVSALHGRSRCQLTQGGGNVLVTESGVGGRDVSQGCFDLRGEFIVLAHG